MFNSLDSRALGRADCYGQRFMRPGDYHYNIVPAYGARVCSDRPFLVRVKDKPERTRMQQNNVPVRWRGNRFEVPGHEIIEIDAGDLVLWNCNERNAPPMAVVGDRDFFHSNRLVNESGYSHAFGSVGEYRWLDAYGSELRGVIRVHDPGLRSDEDHKRWCMQLAKGTLVTIQDGRVQPAEVDIVVGQTVFFMVITGPGISITDERLLLHAHEGPGAPQRQE